MKKILFAVVACFVVCAFAFCAENPFVKRKEIARSLYGKIYVTNYQREADYTVRVTKRDASADLLVYETKDARFAGLWEFVKRREDADFTIYYTQSDLAADICVCFVGSVGRAGPNLSLR